MIYLVRKRKTFIFKKIFFNSNTHSTTSIIHECHTMTTVWEPLLTWQIPLVNITPDPRGTPPTHLHPQVPEEPPGPPWSSANICKLNIISTLAFLLTLLPTAPPPRVHNLHEVNTQANSRQHKEPALIISGKSNARTCEGCRRGSGIWMQRLEQGDLGQQQGHPPKRKSTLKRLKEILLQCWNIAKSWLSGK